MTIAPAGDGAAVQTATVEIATLTFSGKQMTQGVFRQLIEQPLISPVGVLNGTPWGTVNYHPEKCEQAEEHLHVVWQSGEVLRRSFVAPPGKAYLGPPTASHYAMARIAEGASISDVDRGFRAYRNRDTSSGASVRFMLRGVLFLAPVPLRFLTAWEQSRGDLPELRATAREHYGIELAPSKDIGEKLPAEAYKAAWASLNGLPQLFIGR